MSHIAAWIMLGGTCDPKIKFETPDCYSYLKITKNISCFPHIHNQYPVLIDLCVKFYVYLFSNPKGSGRLHYHQSDNLNSRKLSFDHEKGFKKPFVSN